MSTLPRVFNHEHTWDPNAFSLSSGIIRGLLLLWAVTWWVMLTDFQT